LRNRVMHSPDCIISQRRLAVKLSTDWVARGSQSNPGDDKGCKWGRPETLAYMSLCRRKV
jgi:hypothetical protein